MIRHACQSYFPFITPVIFALNKPSNIINPDVDILYKMLLLRKNFKYMYPRVEKGISTCILSNLYPSIIHYGLLVFCIYFNFWEGLVGS